MTMSSMLSKTWNYLHTVTLDPAPGWSVPSQDQRHHLPSGLSSWLQQVTACLDKDEERELVSRQLEVIIRKLSSKNVSPGVSSDCLVRLVYIHLLGYDCSSSFIHCVKLAGGGTVLARKMGYLACHVMIPPTHDLMLLLTNTILTDISSSNMIDIQLGLVAAANLVTKHLIQLVPVLVERVTPLLRHSCHLIRKKALTLLDYLSELDESEWRSGVCEAVISSLADSNPGVVIGAVQTLSRHMSDQDQEESVRTALRSALQLHQTLTSGEEVLGGEYQYRGHSVPHLQIYCVRLYRSAPALVTSDTDLADTVVSTLQSCLNTYTGSKDLIIQALLYETVVTISSLPCAHCLISLALKSVGSFLTSRHHSLVYTGLCALDTVFRVKPPTLTSDQETAVLSCIAHPDPGIQRRAAELMLVVASEKNVVSIVDRVLTHVSRVDSSKTDYSLVIERVVTLIERLADSVQDCDWLANTLLRLVQVSKHEQRDKMMETLKFLLTQADEGDAASVLEMNRVRLKLRSLLSDIIQSRVSSSRPVPPPVTSLRVWCDAQFYTPEEEDSEEIVKKIIETGRDHWEQRLVLGHCVGALQTLVMRHGSDIIGEEGGQFILQCCDHDHEQVSLAAEQCHSIISQSSSSSTSSRLLSQSPPDLTLSFLDKIISDGLRSGQYKPRRPRLQSSYLDTSSSQLILSPYNVLPASRDSGHSAQSREDISVRSGQSRVLWTSEGRVETPDIAEHEEEHEHNNEDEEKPPQQIRTETNTSVLNDDWD